MGRCGRLVAPRRLAPSRWLDAATLPIPTTSGADVAFGTGSEGSFLARACAARATAARRAAAQSTLPARCSATSTVTQGAGPPPMRASGLPRAGGSLASCGVAPSGAAMPQRTHASAPTRPVRQALDDKRGGRRGMGQNRAVKSIWSTSTE